MLVVLIMFSLLIFAIGNIIAFKYTSVGISIFLFLILLYWIRYYDIKWLKKLLITYITTITLYIIYQLYIMTTEIYLDGSKAIWMNGQLMTQDDAYVFSNTLNHLENYNTFINKHPSYTLSFMQVDDMDPRHLHIFRYKNLIYQGCLLGLEGGLLLKGYRLTKESDKILKYFDHKYQTITY